MTLVRWNPTHDFSLLQNRVNRLFDDAVRSWLGNTNSSRSGDWTPLADVYETGNDFIVKVELPGIDAKAIDVRVENNVLTIRGERKFQEDVDEENYHRLERLYGTFSRSFTLPQTIDSDKIAAEYRDGVLTLKLPKAEKARTKRIQIAA
jgi:HSP20 family protein